MTKAEVIKSTQALAEEAGVKLSKKDIETVTEALFEAIVDGVNKDGRVKFNEITYSIKEVPEKSGKIMIGEHKGEMWTTPAHKEISVKASKSLKQMVD